MPGLSDLNMINIYEFVFQKLDGVAIDKSERILAVQVYVNIKSYMYVTK